MQRSRKRAAEPEGGQAAVLKPIAVKKSMARKKFAPDGTNR
jgi:hypothetical protein